MTTFLGKQILLVGEENTQILSIKNKLNEKGASTKSLASTDLSHETVNSKKFDLVILNNLEKKPVNENLKQFSSYDDTTYPAPVFILVDGKTESIRKALDGGAADYITSTETIDSILQKIEAVFSEKSVFSNSSSIDITPIEANISVTGIKVFVIEDDALLRNLLSIRLDKSSFPHEFSKDGQNVLGVIQKFKPDIIILDLMLPGKSGFDVLSEIKSNAATANIPVMVFSNKDGAGDRAKAKELGAVSFYVKAMTDLSELIETIEHLAKK